MTRTLKRKYATEVGKKRRNATGAHQYFAGEDFRRTATSELGVTVSPFSAPDLAALAYLLASAWAFYPRF